MDVDAHITGDPLYRLKQDHRQTQDDLTQLQTFLDPEDLSAFHSAWTAFKMALHCHFVCEEQGLFTVLNGIRPMVLMEVEHDDLNTLIQAVDDALSICQPSMTEEGSDRLTSAFQKLDETLRGHIREEDQGIFPLVEKFLEPELQQLIQRRIEELYTLQENQLLDLLRPKSTCQIKDTPLHTLAKKTITYHTLFEADQSSIQQVQLQAGERQSLHWAPHYQCLFLLEGEARFHNHQTKETMSIQAGQQINLSPRFWFYLEAVSDCRFWVIKIFPRLSLQPPPSLQKSKSVSTPV